QQRSAPVLSSAQLLLLHSTLIVQVDPAGRPHRDWPENVTQLSPPQSVSWKKPPTHFRTPPAIQLDPVPSQGSQFPWALQPSVHPALQHRWIWLLSAEQFELAH